VLVGESRIDEGLHILEESCEHWLQNGSKLRFAACGSMLAAVYSDLTRRARADRQKEMELQCDSKVVDYFQRSIELARKIGAKGTLAQAYREWGNFYKDKGNIDEAKDCFLKAAAYFRQCGAEKLLRQVEDEQNNLN
jgi:tetratricopeptide (TPR) repeat protein